MSLFNHRRSDQDPSPAPTVVIVHGAFADSSAFATVATQLTGRGIATMAVANPLRDLAGDAGYVRSVLETVPGPVIVVGHSYAGSVITEATAGNENVVGLVYVAAFIPEIGESSGGLNASYPGSLLTPDNLITRTSPEGFTDLYIKPDRFEEVYAAGLSQEQVQIAAFAQRPITNEALLGTVTQVPSPHIPRWQIVATRDGAVPVALQRFLAERAGAQVIEADCGHDVAAARPEAVVQAILAAAGRTE